MADNNRRIEEVARSPRQSVPTLAIAGGTVGHALARQLRPITEELTETTLSDCRHILPLEQSDALTAILAPFLGC
jgi:hypothetical protein